MIQKEISKATIARDRIVIGLYYVCSGKENIANTLLLAKNDEMLIRQQDGFLEFSDGVPMTELETKGKYYYYFVISMDSVKNLNKLKRLNLTGKFESKLLASASNEQIDKVTTAYAQRYCTRMQEQAEAITGTKIETKILSISTEELSEPTITFDFRNVGSDSDVPMYEYRISLVAESKEKK